MICGARYTPEYRLNLPEISLVEIIALRQSDEVIVVMISA